jgi:hypothetical protein
MIYDPNPAPLTFALGHGHGALPTLDVYDERAQ